MNRDDYYDFESILMSAEDMNDALGDNDVRAEDVGEEKKVRRRKKKRRPVSSEDDLAMECLYADPKKGRPTTPVRASAALIDKAPASSSVERPESRQKTYVTSRQLAISLKAFRIPVIAVAITLTCYGIISFLQSSSQAEIIVTLDGRPAERLTLILKSGADGEQRICEISNGHGRAPLDKTGLYRMSVTDQSGRPLSVIASGTDDGSSMIDEQLVLQVDDLDHPIYCTFATSK